MRLCDPIFGCLMLMCFVDVVLSFSCKTPPTPKNGRIRSRQRGKILKFICNQGYQLAGERTTICTAGTWDVPIPKCVRTTCAKRDSAPANGVVLTSHGGAVLNYYCQHGFELNGPGIVYCDGTNWDNNKPSCIPSNTPVPLFCDFEDVNICHWTHDLNHDMDWVRDSYKTPTGYSMPTGPSFDHTKGEASNGHYMYIESSSRKINDTARLISPIFGNLTGNICLEFWYHMYGKTTGTLRSYVRKLSDPWPLDPKTAIFEKSGNQGNVWYRAYNDLGVIDEEFQIIMEGVRGDGYVSDIAIDDIKLTPNCVFEIPITTTEIILSTEKWRPYESCTNQCGLKSYLDQQDSEVIPCDCDDDCYENSRCCPDYIDLCINSITTTDSTTILEEVMTTKRSPISTSIPRTSATTRTPSTTKKRATTPTSPLKPSPTVKSPSKPTNSIRRMTFSTMRTPITTPRKPIIIILHPPTTPEIVEKILPKTTPSKVIFIKPKQPTTFYDHDGLEMPKTDSNSNEINEIEEEEESIEEKYLHDKDDEHLDNVKSAEINNNGNQDHVTVVAIATVCVLAGLGASIAVILLVKYKFIAWRRSVSRSGQGDSQSDVRFLTADEVLDFSVSQVYED